MQDSSGHPFGRPGRLNTYTAYSIGSFIAWAVIWAIFAATAQRSFVAQPRGALSPRACG